MNKTGWDHSALKLLEAIEVAPDSVVSRSLEQTDGFSVTLFAMDAGQEISAHSAPKDAYVLVLDGELEITVGDIPSLVRDNSLLKMPAGIPHALNANEASRFILFMNTPTD